MHIPNCVADSLNDSTHDKDDIRGAKNPLPAYIVGYDAGDDAAQQCAKSRRTCDEFLYLQFVNEDLWGRV